MKSASIVIGLVLLVALSSVASALTITSVSVSPFSPGQEQSLTISLKNTLDDDAEDVSLSLQLSNTQFIAVGSSEDSLDEIREGREKSMGFTLRPAYDITPGDYSIPYTLSYSVNEQRLTRQGTFGVSVAAAPELSFTVSETNQIINQQGTITLQIINNGLADARFVSVRMLPDGFTALSDTDVYIGTIDSDDFETVSFDVVFKRDDPVFNAIIEYRDLDNQRITRSVALPIEAYTQEEAEQIGLVTASNTLFYVIVVVILVVLWFVWRSFRKRRRMRAAPTE